MDGVRAVNGCLQSERKKRRDKQQEEVACHTVTQREKVREWSRADVWLLLARRR